MPDKKDGKPSKHKESDNRPRPASTPDKLPKRINKRPKEDK